MDRRGFFKRAGKGAATIAATAAIAKIGIGKTNVPEIDRETLVSWVKDKHDLIGVIGAKCYKTTSPWPEIKDHLIFGTAPARPAKDEVCITPVQVRIRDYEALSADQLAAEKDVSLQDLEKMKQEFVNTQHRYKKIEWIKYIPPEKK